MFYYGAVNMTRVISRVHLVHLTNAGQRQMTDDLQTRPTDLATLGRESACRLLYGLRTPSPFIITQSPKADKPIILHHERKAAGGPISYEIY